MLLSTPTSSNTSCTPSVTVVVKSGSIKEDIVFAVTDEGIHPEGDISTCVIHFSVPPSKWWADVRFACSTIQVFRDQADVIEWVSNMSLVVQLVLLKIEALVSTVRLQPRRDDWSGDYVEISKGKAPSGLKTTANFLLSY